jgi:hypothetical protein
MKRNHPKFLWSKVKLPKLEVRKFSGNIQDWREFWDSFETPYIKMMP